MKPHRGTLILALGVLSILGCIPLGPIAWWMGMHDVMRMADGKIDRRGKLPTDIGRFLGMTVTVLTCFVLLVSLVVNLVAGG